MRKFDYKFLKRISVPADIMNSATSIYEMKAKAELRQTDFADVFSAMESVAKIQSVKSSNAIEGIITTDKRIRDIVNKSTATRSTLSTAVTSTFRSAKKVYSSCTKCFSGQAATASQGGTRQRTIS